MNRSMIQTQHTPGCYGNETDWIRVTDRNRRIGASEFHYLRCERCGLIRLDNVPADLGDYYPNDYYELPTLAQLAEVAAADPFKIETVRRFAQPGRLLEIGPAHGAFAFQAKQAGFQVDTIEMDARCCDYLNRVVGVHTVCSATPHEAMDALGAHDVIALWHVIEHLPDPWALLKAAANNLAPDGILVLATPNPDAWQFRVMGKEWPHLDAPRHLYLLPVQVLTEYAQALRLERLHYATTDSDAKHWNRFGWQRLLMNRVRGKWMERAAFVVGYALSIFLTPFESRDPKGSTYTLVFRKTDT
jgi:2-polyprenyl-3-methyl-5-hydroxy-6-metoxy-1,4-benzoquinol methylase